MGEKPRLSSEPVVEVELHSLQGDVDPATILEIIDKIDNEVPKTGVASVHFPETPQE